MRRAGNRGDGNAGDGNRLAVGAYDHRHLHPLGVGAGVGRSKVDDVAKANFSVVEFVAPQMMMAWKVSGLSHSPAIVASRPTSMRLAIAISPSRHRQSELLDRAARRPAQAAARQG
jgi:hypothetical protein